MKLYYESTVREIVAPRKQVKLNHEDVKDEELSFPSFKNVSGTLIPSFFRFQ
jgi:hypothetical protein